MTHEQLLLRKREFEERRKDLLASIEMMDKGKLVMHSRAEDGSMIDENSRLIRSAKENVETYDWILADIERRLNP